jgi:hypothetical protein
MTNYSSIRYASSGTTVYADMNALIAATGSDGAQAFVQSNNNIYVYSGTGWYKIATVQNDSPSAITGVNGTYSLTTDGTPTVITAVSTDPEGFPLTWSYSTSGLGSIATVSQVDNVFTITPSTTEADAGIFSLTINATDGVNGAVSANTSITLEFQIVNSNYTTLLATTVDTSDNSNITDSSTNNHTITVLGDADAGTFSPYRHGGYSTYFDGTDDFLEGPSVDLMGSGAFTVECWVYVLSNGTNYTDAFLAQYQTNNKFIFGVKSNVVRVWMSATEVLVGTTNINNNGWHHVALVRNESNSCQVYVDGVAEGSAFTNSTDFSASLENFEIGSWDNGGGSDLHGYIRDLRVVKGTAVYTSAFTPPTEPLTAIANTSLLTCHLPYITDGSSNGHVITRNGSTSVKPFTLFDNLEYTAADHGGSIYFDGTGDGLIIPAAAWDRDADYTVECWGYAISYLHVAMSRNRHAADGIIFSIGGSNGIFLGVGRDNVDQWDLTYTGSVDLRHQWHHLALTHDASEKRYKIYVDGVNVFNGTSAYHPGSLNSVVNIGCSDTMNSGTNGYTQGWIADHRITDSIVYTSDFTPPFAPLSTTGSVFHLKGIDASIIDKSQTSNLNLVGNTTGSTTQVKFTDTKSIYLDGASDYIITTQQELGTEDFTIEGWHYLLSRSNNRNGIFGNYSSYSAGSLGMFAGHSSGSSTSYQVAYNGAAFPASVIQGGTIVYNQWVHFAVVRNSGIMNLYIDGTSVDSISATASLNGVGSNFIVGAPSDNLSDGMQGYLQDFRITKGLARYTANFTPPTEPLKG